jgi:hypothetical protein
MKDNSTQIARRNFYASQKNGVLYLEISPDLNLGVEDAREFQEYISSIIENTGRPIPAISTLKGQVHFNKSARRYYQEYEQLELLVSHAIIVPNGAMRALMNFILAIVPCKAFEIKVFSNEEDSITWTQKKILESKHAVLNTKEIAELSEYLNKGVPPLS